MNKQRIKDYNKKYWTTYTIRIRENLVMLEKRRESARKYYNKNKNKISDYQKKRKLRLRFTILEEYQFTCQYCGRKAPDAILQIDHIKPLSKGGKNEKENLVVACAECNAGKGDVLLKSVGIKLTSVLVRVDTIS